MIRGWCILALVLTPAALPAEQPARQPDVPVVRLTLRPTPAPTPALKYTLLPPLQDQTAGNAALLYLRATTMLMERREQYKELLRSEELMERPLARLTKQELRHMTLGYRNVLKEVHLAALAHRCEWGLDFRKEGIDLLLPEIQGMRMLVRPIVLAARAQMAQGQFDEAIETLRDGFTLGRNVGEGTTLIQALVGMAVTAIMAEQVEQLMQLPGAPNLYWALTTMPRPFIDLRKPMQGESTMLVKTLPVLRDIESRVLSPLEMKRVGTQLLRLLGAMEGRKPNEAAGEAGLALVAMKLYPEARRALIASGRKAAEVEAMPALQVILLQSLRQYRSLQDDTFKWFYVPYAEARAGLKRQEDRIRQAKAKMEALPFLLLLPAVTKVHEAGGRTETRLAALRCLEAIRLHAAAHGGQLPATLADIKLVPVPRNPLTGKPFEYRAVGGKATLYVPPPPGEAAHLNNSRRYELTLAR
jgi:hypothetical protein